MWFEWPWCIISHIPNSCQAYYEHEIQILNKNGKFFNGGYGKISNIIALVLRLLKAFDYTQRHICKPLIQYSRPRTLSNGQTKFQNLEKICKPKSILQYDSMPFLDQNTFLTPPGIICSQERAKNLKNSCHTSHTVYLLFQNHNHPFMRF